MIGVEANTGFFLLAVLLDEHEHGAGRGNGVFSGESLALDGDAVGGKGENGVRPDRVLLTVA